MIDPNYIAPGFTVVAGGYDGQTTRQKGSAVISTWARIEARTYDEALELMDKLTRFPSALVQDGETSWSIYVSAEASEVPRVMYGLGVDPTRISLFDQRPETAPVLDRVLSD